MSKKTVAVLMTIYLLLAGCVTNSVPMTQYVATQQQVNLLTQKINSLETEQAALKTKIGELNRASRLPTGVNAVPTARRVTDKGENQQPIMVENPSFQEALARYKAGDIQGAISQFENIINSGASGTELTEIQYWLGDGYYNQRNFDLASRYFGAYLKENSTGDHAPAAMNKLVQALKSLGREGDAEVLSTQGIQALQ